VLDINYHVGVKQSVPEARKEICAAHEELGFIPVLLEPVDDLIRRRGAYIFKAGQAGSGKHVLYLL
jgi:hypothetical protein